MDQPTNGANGHIVKTENRLDFSQVNGFHEPTIEELERELPVVHDGQVPLGDLLSRVVQSIYAELSELAETWVRF